MKTACSRSRDPHLLGGKMWVQFGMKMFVLWTILYLPDVQAISTYFMDVNCGKVISTARSGAGAFRVSLTQNSKYSRGLNCHLVVEARPGHRLMFYFDSFDIKFYSFVRFGGRHSGCIDYITLRDGRFSSSPYIKGFTSGICGYSHGDNSIYNSTKEYVSIGFHSDPENWSSGNAGFTLIFTEFHTGACTSDEFKCHHNKRCIQDAVRCNHNNPCGDHTSCLGLSDTRHSSSESGQSSSESRGLDVPTVIGIVVSVGFLIILLILVVAVIKSRRFQSRNRRCRRRHEISFIDVDSSSNMTQLRLPSYEEVCGGSVGPYEAMPPPPYAEQDPNKSNETLTRLPQTNGATQSVRDNESEQDSHSQRPSETGTNRGAERGDINDVMTVTDQESPVHQGPVVQN